MTILELMIVLAIIGGGVVLVRSGFRMLTKADLVENATELAAMLQAHRASSRSRSGEMHRVVLDLDKQHLRRRGLPGRDARHAQRAAASRRRGATKRALERGKQRMQRHAGRRARRGDRRRGDEAGAGDRRPPHRGSRVRARRRWRCTGDASGKRVGLRKLRAEQGDQVQGDLGPAPGRQHDQGPGRDLLLPDGLGGEGGRRGHGRQRDVHGASCTASPAASSSGTARCATSTITCCATRWATKTSATRGASDEAQRTRGFTLLEVMIGLALLGLALTVLIKSAARQHLQRASRRR